MVNTVDSVLNIGGKTGPFFSTAYKFNQYLAAVPSAAYSKGNCVNLLPIHLSWVKNTERNYHALVAWFLIDTIILAYSK
jgi:hypothetical protein